MSAYTQIDEGKQEKEFSDFIDQLLCRKLCLVHLHTGSCFEIPAIYFLENVTDIDNVKYRRNICAVNSDAKAPEDFKGTLLIIRSEESHCGYLKLYYATISNELIPYTYATLPEQRPAYSQVFLQKSDIPVGLASASTSKWLANFQALYRDMVGAIWCPNWPREANEWRLRERKNGWPQETTVNRIVNNGCFIVAKPHQGSQLCSNEWRFSFSEAELILIHTWSEEQMFVYHILRQIKTDVVGKCGGKKLTSLTTYHFKTLMLWACEENPNEFWSFDSMTSSIQKLLITMSEWLISKYCRNYFMPGNNMLDHLPVDHDFEREVQFLTESLKLVDQLALQNTFGDRWKLFPLRIPNNMLFTLQLRIRFSLVADPSRREGSQLYAHDSDFEKSNLFRSNFFNLFQCLTIHRHLALSSDLNENLNGSQEVEECFKREAEKTIDGFTQIDISPMDKLHVIIAKLLCKKINNSYSDESRKSNSQKEESIHLHRNCTHRKLCYSRTELLSQRSDVASILELIFSVMNEKMVKPTYFHTAAYESRFYWTISGE